MARLRSVNTHFWKDRFVADLDPTEKLLFLYLLTNQAASLAGCFELSLKEMAFDTGIDRDMVMKILTRLEADGKVVYKQGWVVLLNFLKHQNLNANMGKAAAKELNLAPAWVRDAVRKANESFGILPEWFGMVKGREENRREDEVEGKQKADGASFDPSPEQIHLDQILEGLRERYGLNTLRDEQGWSTAVDWAYRNNFSAEDFLACFDLLRAQDWRKGRITPENVADNLPELAKLRPAGATEKVFTGMSNRERIAIEQARLQQELVH